MKIYKTSKFNKELKKLTKKYRRLTLDLDVFLQLQQYLHQNTELKRAYCNSRKLTVLFNSQDHNVQIIKARLKSRDLRNDNLRVIYQVIINVKQINLIEIYAKNKRETETESRWRAMLKS